ncbi:MAG: hypothetical protein JJE04_06645 [Acidobacteriia bacterium]|nr:hypothetical protein [Terriglobia bacterium]
MKFILEQQAQTAVFQAQAVSFQAATEKRFDAISKLLQTGMRMLVDYQKETNTRMNTLIDAQMRNEESIRKTDDRFNRWLDAQRGGATNGH